MERPSNFTQESQIIQDKKIMKLDSTSSIIQKIHPDHIWINLSSDMIKTARAIEANYSNRYAKSQAFLNYLCQVSFQDWMQIKYELKNVEKSSPELWEFISGFSIQVNNKKLVLIPSDSRDIEGFSIEQEWIDIPSLAADFYLPVQVNIEERCLHIWGFISRVDVKKYAFYHPRSRKYLIDRNYLLDDFDILRDCCQFGESEKGTIDPLPLLSAEEAIELIQELSQPSNYSPRLNLSFEKWGALLNTNQWLEQLVYERIEARVITLSSWFKNLFPLRSQAIEISTENTPKRLAFLAPITEKITPLSTDDIQATVRQLYASQKEVNYHEELSPQESLAKLQHQTSNETIRWKAAEYLWTIDPHYPNAAIRRKLDIGSQLGESKIALMVGVLATDNGQIAVLLRSHPLEEGTKLPSGLSLRVLDETGEPIPGLAATSREKAIDSYIQLYFLADAGDRFTVTLTLGDNRITEQFKI
jgi:hypothetical protein